MFQNRRIIIAVMERNILIADIAFYIRQGPCICCIHNFRLCLDHIQESPKTGQAFLHHLRKFHQNLDWADEGDVFFCSVESNERLKKLRDLLDLYVELNLLPSRVEMYWGTNEFFDFTPEELKQFIDDAIDISEEELAVLNKFGIAGFDIYERIEDELSDGCLISYKGINKNMTEEGMIKIKNLYIELFSEEYWKDIEKRFNEYLDRKHEK